MYKIRVCYTYHRENENFPYKKNHKLFLPIILFLSRDAVQPRHVIFVICPGGSISEIVDKSNENSSLHESPENYPPLDDH